MLRCDCEPKSAVGSVYPASKADRGLRKTSTELAKQRGSGDRLPNKTRLRCDRETCRNATKLIVSLSQRCAQMLIFLGHSYGGSPIRFLTIAVMEPERFNLRVKLCDPRTSIGTP